MIEGFRSLNGLMIRASPCSLSVDSGVGEAPELFPAFALSFSCVVPPLCL